MVKLQIYPIDLTYKIVRDKAVVYIYGRTIDGKQICVVDEGFEPYFYSIPANDKSVDSAREEIEKTEVEKSGTTAKVVRTELVTKKVGAEEVTAIKVVTNLPKAVPAISYAIKDSEFVEKNLEFDILFTRRYLVDKKIVPLVLTDIEAEPMTEKSRVPMYRLSSIEQTSSETYQELKLLAFDIETYNPRGKSVLPEKDPIIMISLYGKDIQKVITWKEFKTDDDYIEFVQGEAEMLERFKELVQEYGPDCIVGYYSDGFDLPYIMKRAEKYKIKLDLGLDYSTPSLGRGRNETVDVTGMFHLDVLAFIRRVIARNLKTDTLKLDDVAFEVLGEKKDDVPIERLAEVWDAVSPELLDFCRYNLKDSRLTYELTDKLLPNLVELVKIVGQSVRDVYRMSFSQIVEWYLIRRAQEFDMFIPNKPGGGELGSRMEERAQGALVYEPKPGLYEDVAVFDFRSLYPTIITSHNISPETLSCACCSTKEKVPWDGQEIWFCKNKEGFFSTVLKEVITRRMRVKDLLKEASGSKRVVLDARQNGLKVVLNSFYGYLGFYAARWYSKNCQEAVTAYGRHYITKVIGEAEKEGFGVLYSDTDSVFLHLLEKSQEDAIRFCEDVNSGLPGLMELEYDGFYPRALFVAIKDSDTGAKKKYALIDEKKHITIKGFETVRRNVSQIAKGLQREVLRVLLEESDAEKAYKYVRSVICDLRDHKVEIEDVVIKTQLTKPIESYSAIGPHVAVAKRMAAKGEEIYPGMRIRYVVVLGSSIIRERARIPEEIEKKDYDPEYYINNQIVPAVEQIFDVFGYTKEDLLAEKEQSKLNKFFG